MAPSFCTETSKTTSGISSGGTAGTGPRADNNGRAAPGHTTGSGAHCSNLLSPPFPVSARKRPHDTHQSQASGHLVQRSKYLISFFTCQPENACSCRVMSGILFVSKSDYRVDIRGQ